MLALQSCKVSAQVWPLSSPLNLRLNRLRSRKLKQLLALRGCLKKRSLSRAVTSLSQRKMAVFLIMDRGLMRAVLIQLAVRLPLLTQITLTRKSRVVVWPLVPLPQANRNNLNRLQVLQNQSRHQKRPA